MTPEPDCAPERGPDRSESGRNEPAHNLTVAIIGAGRLGRSLAFRAARAGFRVLLEDVLPSNLNRARESLRRDLTQKKKAERANDPASEAGRSLTAGSRSQDAPRASAPEETNLAEPFLAETFPVAFVASIEDAVRPASLVIDCVPDELESKLEILWLLDRMAPPHTVFATPTRALSIADLAACTYRPDKCVALAVTPSDLDPADLDPSDRDSADLAPADLEPANLNRCAGTPIELRITAATSKETLALVERFWRALGFEPVFRL
jgi:3-hydroxybutyryl-CoA dehydrogenase